MAVALVSMELFYSHFYCFMRLKCKSIANYLIYVVHLMADTATKIEASRVYWRSRRGLLELDLFLMPFAKSRYGLLSATDKAAYQALLRAEDVDLCEWLNKRSQPENLQLQDIVKQVIAYAAAH